MFENSEQNFEPACIQYGLMKDIKVRIPTMNIIEEAVKYVNEKFDII